MFSTTGPLTAADFESLATLDKYSAGGPPMKLRSAPDEIARTLAVLFQAGDVVEMRALKRTTRGHCFWATSPITCALARAIAGARNGDHGGVCARSIPSCSLLLGLMRQPRQEPRPHHHERQRHRAAPMAAGGCRSGAARRHFE